MTTPKPKFPNSKRSTIDPELYRRLQAEAKAPYRSFRRFFYVSFAGSGFVGGVVFLAKLAAGRDLETTLPSLALQSGVVVLMVYLLIIDTDKPDDDRSVK